MLTRDVHSTSQPSQVNIHKRFLAVPSQHNRIRLHVILKILALQLCKPCFQFRHQIPTSSLSSSPLSAKQTPFPPLTSISQPPKEEEEEEEENTPSNPSNPFYYFHNPATTKLSNNIPSFLSKHKEKIPESKKTPRSNKAKTPFPTPASRIMLTPFNLQLKRKAKTTPQQNKTTSEKKKHNKKQNKTKKPKKIY
jgi:hypothetical protein